MFMIETKNLYKRYGKVFVLDDVNMHIPEGSIYGFIGENGSGKTTLMRVLTGLANPTKGNYYIQNVSNLEKEIYTVRQKTSAIVEATSLIPTMTARDNLKYACLYLGIPYIDEKMDALLHLVKLGDVGNKKVKNFSLGMKQRLGIALALINDPMILFLDEPLNGLDPQGIAELRNLLLELNKEKGITMLISSHILSELEKIATHYGFITHGKLIEEISAIDLFKKGQKSTTIKVDDVTTATTTLEEMKLRFVIKEAGEISIYDNVNISKLIGKLSQYNVSVLAVNSNEESIEEYYFSLIGGVKND